MGATSGFKVGIATPVPLDIQLITAGAVNSWLAGNFNYDLSAAYPDVSKGQLSEADAESISKLTVGMDSAGIFNLPVCKVLDLRSFPNAAAGTGFKNSMCDIFLFLSLAIMFPCSPSLHHPIIPPSSRANPTPLTSSLRLRLQIRGRRHVRWRQHQVLRPGHE